MNGDLRRFGAWQGRQKVTMYGEFRQLSRGKVIWRGQTRRLWYFTLVVFNDTSELISPQAEARNF